MTINESVTNGSSNMQYSKVLTTSTGNPIDDNQHSITAGPTGPVLLEDFHLIDKLAHFDRERIPERVVHAKGAGAFGYFEVTHNITHLTRARFLSQVGKRTEVAARFSTVGGEKGSADTERDPRGFAVKFYTEEGNWDFVGNNTPVFFVRDGIKFMDFIHTQKRNPQTNCKDPNMVWDFFSLVPEAMHQLTILFSDRGIPDGYRHMNGYASHTFKLVNSKGHFRYCKWHFKTDQGIKTIRAKEATRLAGVDPDYSTRDLFNAIEKGDYPTWTVYLQVMEPEVAETYKWNILDVTKVIPHADAPLIPVGKLVLNRNPENYFAEVEQIAFSPGHLVPGIEASHDKMLQARLFSYPDTHRHRLGTANYNQIPVNRPRCPMGSYQRDGFMAINGNYGSRPNYEPNSYDDMPKQNNTVGTTYTPHPVTGNLGRHQQNIVDADFAQAGDLYRLMSDDQKDQLIENIVGSLSGAKDFIQKRMVPHFYKADEDYGRRIEEGLKRMAGTKKRSSAEMS